MVGVAIGGETYDLITPLPSHIRDGVVEGAVDVAWVEGKSGEGDEIVQHSGAHLLGAVLEAHIPEIQLVNGPPLGPHEGPGGGGGFYYEYTGGRSVGRKEFGQLEKAIKKLVKSKAEFERYDNTSLDGIKAVFGSANEGKVERAEALMAQGIPVSVYKVGPFVDLCAGPHVPTTGSLMDLTLVESAGLASGGFRVYGRAFTHKGEKKAWKARLREAAARDHRSIGKKQELWMFHEASPGSPYLLPHGTRIYNALVSRMKNEVRVRGYDEVVTPLVFKPEVWKVSGHWDKYADDMYAVAPLSHLDEPQPDHQPGSGGCGCDDEPAEASDGAEVFGLKPMNCPSHCLIFASKLRSYKDLPIRFADFSPLHRNEVAGALSGLTRVRKFAQDDGHVFCGTEDVEGEIADTLAFIQQLYGSLGFEVRIKLSTRPEMSIGSDKVWEEAESGLESALSSLGVEYEVNAGDGAFYGPKIDVDVGDALGRTHQCGTIQLDFNLPHRFGLSYVGPNGESKVPILIHRAVLGSVERFMAILAEHTGGDWPVWCSPRHVLVASTSDDIRQGYGQDLVSTLVKSGVHAELAPSGSLGKQIKRGVQLRYNYIGVVGEDEASQGTVMVRERGGGNGSGESMSVDGLLGMVVNQL